MMKADIVHRCYDETGEAATWIPALGCLFWVDIDNGVLHRYDPERNEVVDDILPAMITSIVPWKDHPKELILSMQDRLVAYDVELQTFVSLVEFPFLGSQMRTNDCKASPEGRLWCGAMDMYEHDGTGCLLCVDSALSLVVVLEQQCIPNGIVWNKEGNRMYYADSGRGCIEEYEYDGLTGCISFLRTAVQVPAEYGVPDGMTIDAEGLLWVAHWGGFGVYVWNPFTGELVDKVEVPVPHVASCTFGGVNRRELFITTARAGLSSAECDMYPLSGSLFVVTVPDVVSGENHYPFIKD